MNTFISHLLLFIAGGAVVAIWGKKAKTLAEKDYTAVRQIVSEEVAKGKAEVSSLGLKFTALENNVKTHMTTAANDIVAQVKSIFPK